MEAGTPRKSITRLLLQELFFSWPCRGHALEDLGRQVTRGPQSPSSVRGQSDGPSFISPHPVSSHFISGIFYHILPCSRKDFGWLIRA